MEGNVKDEDNSYTVFDLDTREIAASSTPIPDEDELLAFDNDSDDSSPSSSSNSIQIPTQDCGAVRPLIDVFSNMGLSPASSNSTPEDLKILSEIGGKFDKKNKDGDAVYDPEDELEDINNVIEYDPEDELEDMNDVLLEGRNIISELSFMSDQDSFLANEFKCELENAKEVVTSDLSSNWTPPKTQRQSPLKPPGSPSSPKEKRLYDRWESAQASPRKSLKRINQEWASITGSKDKKQVRVHWGPDEQITVETLRWHKDLEEARIGPWLDMALEREEFEYRLMDAEYVIGPVLDPGHRA